MKHILRLAAVWFSITGLAEAALSIGGKFGTLGAGVDLTARLNDQLNLRVGGNYITYHLDILTDDIDYAVDTHFENLVTTLDWHPFENNFRISAGAVFNQNQLDMEATVSSPVEIGGATFSPSEIGTLRGVASFDNVAPYLGIGFGNAAKDDAGLTFVFDIGVMFQGAPDVELTADGTAADNEYFQEQLAIEEQDAEEVGDLFRFYPVLSIGIAYCFW